MYVRPSLTEGEGEGIGTCGEGPKQRKYYWSHTIAAVICNSQRVGKGAPWVAGILGVGVRILQEAVGHRVQQGRGDIVRGAWGVLGKTHTQGVVGEVQRPPVVEDQNLDPRQGALDQVVLGGNHPDGMDSNRLADL